MALAGFFGLFRLFCTVISRECCVDSALAIHDAVDSETAVWVLRQHCSEGVAVFFRIDQQVSFSSLHFCQHLRLNSILDLSGLLLGSQCTRLAAQ